MAHIVRLDKPKNSTKGTHGWQVRGSARRGYHSKLFSDRMLGGREASLKAAQEYLAEYRIKHPELGLRPQKPFHDGKILNSNKSGITGVYYTQYAHRWDKERTVSYWCAFVARGPKGQKRWHKKFNIDRYGFYEAKRLAIEFRKEWEKAISTEDPKVLEDFFEEYHFSRIIDTRFGSDDWDSLLEGLMEIDGVL
jgi:hypothetical protein